MIRVLYTAKFQKIVMWCRKFIQSSKQNDNDRSDPWQNSNTKYKNNCWSLITKKPAIGQCDAYNTLFDSFKIGFIYLLIPFLVIISIKRVSVFIPMVHYFLKEGISKFLMFVTYYWMRFLWNSVSHRRYWVWLVPFIRNVEPQIL